MQSSTTCIFVAINDFAPNSEIHADTPNGIETPDPVPSEQEIVTTDLL
jgi:hypothetical protein